MVFLIGASSLHRATETLSPEDKTLEKRNIFTVPGLSLIYYSKNPQK